MRVTPLNGWKNIDRKIEIKNKEGKGLLLSSENNPF